MEKNEKFVRLQRELQGTFHAGNTSTEIARHRFNSWEVKMTRVIKKIHPGTIASLIVIGIIVALVVIFFIV
jgi:hypothetical protein